MAWGWETANIGQSKLSWVLLGFGEWKADKAIARMRWVVLV